MRDQDNIWKDRFNETSLESESWLQPGDRVFEGIMQEVNSKPKRRVFFWLWFGTAVAIVVALLSLMAVRGPSAPGETSLLDTDSQVQENSYINAVTDSDDTADLNSNKEEESKLINASEGFVDTQSAEKLPSSSEKDDVQSNVFRISTTSKKSFTEQSVEIPLKQEQQSQIKEAETEKEKSVITGKLESLNRLPVIAQELNVNYNPMISPTAAFTSIEPNAGKGDWSLGVYLGASIWDFQLNNNYNTALNPADFRHDLGKSSVFGIELNTRINPKLNAFARLGIEHVVFHSGHNSSLVYDSANEVNNAPLNDYDLVMASPVGFMNTDLSIQRSSQQELGATDIVVDLNSTHRITNIDLELGLSVNVLQTDFINLNVDVMGGINNFSAVRNTIETVTVNHTDLMSFGAEVSQSQDRIDDKTPYGGIGLRALRQLNREFTLSLQMSYKANLEAIYRQDDFSTTINRYQATLLLSKKF